MDESIARAERLRAMREAASSANTDARVKVSAPSSAPPAPFSDLGDGGDHRTPGFYTGAGASNTDVSIISADSPSAYRAPPPPPPPPRWLGEQNQCFGGGSGRGRGRGGGSRGHKAPRVGDFRPENTFNPAKYYKVHSSRRFALLIHNCGTDTRSFVSSGAANDVHRSLAQS